MKLFVGLGNPGSKYARNRHNVGFMILDRIAEQHGFKPWRRRFSGITSEGEIAGAKVLLLKPETYMNGSGQSVGEAARYLKLTPADVIAFHDDIDLAPGKIKIKTGGGNAGHNGLRSLSGHIGNDYMRVRIGVGHPGAKELVDGWVLRDFAKADAEWLEPLLDAMTSAAGRLATDDDARFLTDVARKLQPAPAQAASEPAPSRPAPAPRHPAGERQGKRQSALAANLKKWLTRRQEKQS